MSVIAAATLFDQGPGSANTAMAAELIGQSNVEYFITHQLPLVIPTSLVVMVLFYFNNRYFDKKDAKKQQDGILQVSNVTATSLVEKPDVPLALRYSRYYLWLFSFSFHLLWDCFSLL